MSQHPISLVVTDDLTRSRLTVFFRYLLAIPHYIWAALWTIGAVAVVIVAWFATLVRGRTPEGMHEFLANYVRYITRLHAYLLLAANPYPTFGADEAYPVDVTFAPPERQHRGKVAARILLAVPALVLTGSLVRSGGYGSWMSNGRRSYEYSSGGAALMIAFLAWFACLARGRMPRGFRDAVVYCIRYSAQTWGYVLLLTDRYPDARPNEPAAAPPDEPHPVALVLHDDLARTRLTVFFRILLALPHLVWIVLWTVALVPTLVVAWILALVRGDLPAALHRFFSAYVRYELHLGAYLHLTANPFPGFTGMAGTYPVDLDLPPEPLRQSRWRIFFRGILVVPAWIAAGGLGSAAFAAGVLGWFASVALGRMPRGFRDLQAWSLRYSAQASAYGSFLTERYPYSGAYEFAEPEPELEAPAVAAA